ncbi:MAG: hypothetical protein L6W00_18270 [Lentisphaeria bacterium]|nr:MAG: hypothetical protein L6W00_18270 [Lentisphaeria bacterium]
MKSKISAKTIQAVNQMCSGAILTGAIPQEEATIILESIKKPIRKPTNRILFVKRSLQLYLEYQFVCWTYIMPRESYNTIGSAKEPFVLTRESYLISLIIKYSYKIQGVK